MGNYLNINMKSMETNIPGVFAAGDIVRGASLVVWGNQRWQRCCSYQFKNI